MGVGGRGLGIVGVKVDFIKVILVLLGLCVIFICLLLVVVVGNDLWRVDDCVCLFVIEVEVVVVGFLVCCFLVFFVVFVGGVKLLIGGILGLLCWRLLGWGVGVVIVMGIVLLGC